MRFLAEHSPICEYASLEGGVRRIENDARVVQGPVAGVGRVATEPRKGKVAQESFPTEKWFGLACCPPDLNVL